jgi:hypothetical protein
LKVIRKTGKVWVRIINFNVFGEYEICFMLLTVAFGLFVVFEFHCDGNWRRHGEVVEEKMLFKEKEVL